MQPGKKTQLVVLILYRQQVLQRGHGHPWIGHKGQNKTLASMLDVFFWTGVSRDVLHFCRVCPDCQLATKRRPPKAPLSHLSIIETLFKRKAMDFVGTLTRSVWSLHYILVIMD